MRKLETTLFLTQIPLKDLFLSLKGGGWWEEEQLSFLFLYDHLVNFSYCLISSQRVTTQL